MPDTNGESSSGLLKLYIALAASVTGQFGATATLNPGLREEIGLSETGIGLIVGCSYATALVSMLFLAPLAVRGHSKKLVVAGLLAGAVGMLWSGTIANGLWDLILARALVGVGTGMIVPTVRGAISVAGKGREGRALGLGVATEAISFIGSVWILGAVNNWFGVRWGFNTAAAVYIAGMLVAAVSAFPTGRLQQKRVLATALRSFLLSNHGKTALVYSVITAVSVSALTFGLLLTMLDAGVSESAAAFVLPLNAVSVALLAGVGGEQSQRRGIHNLGLLGSVGIGVALLGIGVAPGWVAAFAVFMLLYGFSEALIRPGSQLSALKSSKQGAETSVMAVLTGSEYVVLAVSTLLAGVAYDIGGSVLLYCATLGVVLVLACLGYVFAKRAFRE